MDYGVKIRCPHCSSLINSTAQHCPWCGGIVNEIKSPPRTGLGFSPSVKEGSLWSWLNLQKKRQEFYSDSATDITEEQYVENLERKLKENEVPASLERKIVQWDDGDVQKLMWFIIPHADVVNPMSYVLLFNHVGKFTFVEEKSYITPPALPTPPGVVKEMQYPNAITTLLIGLLLLFGGLIMLSLDTGELTGMLVIAGMVLSAWGGYGCSKRSEIKMHNDEVKKQSLAWNQAWDDWYSNRLYASFQEDVHGELSRIFDAVFSTIKQVNSELFEEKYNMTESAEDTKLKDMQELTEHFRTHREEER